MSYESCVICEDDITNDVQVHSCEKCHDATALLWRLAKKLVANTDAEKANSIEYAEFASHVLDMAVERNEEISKGACT